MFGRKKLPDTNKIRNRKIYLISGLLIFLMVIIFRSAQLFSDGTISRFMLITYPFDQQISKSVSLVNDLIQGKVNTGSNIIDQIFMPFTQEKKGLISVFAYFLPEQYALIASLARFSKDIHSLVGMESPQTYLIVLQNSAEKRPNGGFFGSFAVVTLDRGRIKTLELHDSYHPEWNRPDTKIVGPVWLEQFMPERDIYFVGANKIGFTYHDGANIKTLYEKSYPGKRVRGVLFLRTDMLEQLIPEIREQLWLRQYLNATVNLREGEERRGKKEAYEGGVKAFVNDHKNELFQSFIQKLPQLITERYINIYLENISGGMHTRLREQGLTTRFESGHAYFWDSNIIFNKIDRFVTKKISLVDTFGQEIAVRNNDIVKLPELSPNTLYTFIISYTLNVPEAYHGFIRKLNNTYNLTLGQREEHILGLDHEWGTRGNVYFHPKREIESIKGDMASERTFVTPFSSNAAYEVMMPQGSNNQTRTLRIQVLTKE